MSKVRAFEKDIRAGKTVTVGPKKEKSQKKTRGDAKQTKNAAAAANVTSKRATATNIKANTRRSAEGGTDKATPTIANKVAVSVEGMDVDIHDDKGEDAEVEAAAMAQEKDLQDAVADASHHGDEVESARAECEQPGTKYRPPCHPTPPK